MRHRIKSDKVGSFSPENIKVEIEPQEDKVAAEDVRAIFEENSGYGNDDEALAAMELYDTPDAIE